MASKEYNKRMNERMQRTSEGKASYEKTVAQNKAIKAFPKKVAKAAGRKAKSFAVRVTKKMMAKMGFKNNKAYPQEQK